MTLAPSGWPAEDQRIFWNIQQSDLPGNPVASGCDGAVATALNGLAARVGEEALRQGGSATDAVLAAALAQIVLGGGAVISFFGILAFMHYDARTGEVASLNAGWNTCRDETNPLTIPGAVNPGGDGVRSMLGAGEPSGRTAMVGGFMRGLEAAHRRYGHLPFAQLFEAAIELAEIGFPVSSSLARYIDVRKADLARLRETRSVFFKADMSPYVEGDHFRQPALAETLRQVAANGADYVYCGGWATRCVTAVQADGGKMTLADLADYRPIWSDPVTYDRGAWRLLLLGAPCEGSINLVEALNLADASGVSRGEHWSRSPANLLRLARCCAVMHGARFDTEEERAAAFPGIGFGREERQTEEHARRLWTHVGEGGPIQLLREGGHSDDVVAVDRWGNMASLCHSINCVIWGKTAINVDGVSIGDPGSYMQPLIAATPRGHQIPNPIELGILSHSGAPQIAWSSMGVGLHYQTVQSLLNVCDFGMTIAEAASAPRLLLPLAPDASHRELILRVVAGEFSDEVLARTGMEIRRLAPGEARFAQGLWVAVARAPDTGSLTAVSPAYTNGRACAY